MSEQSCKRDIKLLAVDPSLTCTGWALFSVEKERLLGVGKVRTLSPNYSMAERLENLQLRVSEMIKHLGLGGSDILICEAQTTMRDPAAAFKVEYVRGIFEGVGRTFGIQVPGRLNPRTVHKEVMGMSGKQLPRAIIKESAVRTVASLFSDRLKTLGFETELTSLKRHQDIIDAILVGVVGLSRIRSASAASIPLSKMFENQRTRRRGIGLR